MSSPLVLVGRGDLGVAAGRLPARTTPTEGPVNNSATTSPSAATTPAPTGAADDPIDRILAISVDGLNPQAIHQLGPSRTPAFHRLIREGATTLNARTAHEETNTLPNHTGMLTGLRVDDRHGGHGVTFNDDNGSTGHGAAGRYVASMFDVVHDLANLVTDVLDLPPVPGSQLNRRHTLNLFG